MRKVHTEGYFKSAKSPKPAPGEIRSLELQVKMLREKRIFLPKQIETLEREYHLLPAQISALERQIDALKRF